MKAVNLIPADRRGSRSSSSSAAGYLRNPVFLLSVVLAVAVGAGVVLEVHSAATKVTARRDALRQLDAQIAKLPKPKPAATGASNTAALRLTAVASVLQHRTTWDGFLSAFSRVVPEDVWVLNLGATGPSATTVVPPAAGSTPAAPAASTPTAFTVTGYTYSQPSVARLMRRLELVPWLQDVSLNTSSKTTLNDRIVYQFTVDANVISLPEVGS